MSGHNAKGDQKAPEIWPLFVKNALKCPLTSQKNKSSDKSLISAFRKIEVYVRACIQLLHASEFAVPVTDMSKKRESELESDLFEDIVAAT